MTWRMLDKRTKEYLGFGIGDTSASAIRDAMRRELVYEGQRCITPLTVNAIPCD